MLISVKWMRFLLMFGYFLLIFLCSRVVDIFSLCFRGTPVTRLVQPVALNVHQLKQIFDNRGINYSGTVDKELADLSEAEYMRGLNASDLKHMRTLITPTPMEALYSQIPVEDKKETVWLVRVSPFKEYDKLLLHDVTWKTIHIYLAQHSVRSATFDCAVDPKFCERVSWREPMLLLILPKGSRTKIVSKKFYLNKQEVMFSWVREQLSVQVQKLDSSEELERNWLNTTKYSNKEIKIIFFSYFEYIPIFFSTLSLRFIGSVKFAMYNVKIEDVEFLADKIEDFVPPAYFVVAKNYSAIFSRYMPIEPRNFFTTVLQPDAADVFSFSLVLVNMFATLKVFQTKDEIYSAWWEIGRVLWVLMSFNFRTFAGWLIVMCIIQWPIVKAVIEISIDLLHAFTLTSFGEMAVMDYQLFSEYPSGFVLSFLMYCFVSTRYFKKYTYWPRYPIEIENDASWMEVLPLDVLFSDTLFRRLMMLAYPETFQTNEDSFQIDTDDDFDAPVTRIAAIRHFWLTPALSTLNTAYIRNLPTWNFRSRSEEEMDTIRNMMDEVEEKSTGFAAEKNGTRKFSEPSKKKWKQRRGKKDYRKDKQFGLNKGNHVPDIEKPGPSGVKSIEKEKPVPKPVRYESSEAERSLKLSECAICLESYESGAVICGLPCRHNFHKDCIVTWLERDNHQCPICRWPAYESNYTLGNSKN